MPAYNFKAQFAAAVESGQKKQTIRMPRTRKTVPGDTLSLFTGMRTKSCRLLARRTCTKVRPLYISDVWWDPSIKEQTHVSQVQVDGHPISTRDLQALAIADGFTGEYPHAAIALIDFIKEHYGLPFCGEIVEWE